MITSTCFDKNKFANNVMKSANVMANLLLMSVYGAMSKSVAVQGLIPLTLNTVLLFILL